MQRPKPFASMQLAAAFALLVLLAAPVFAGTVYVPLATEVEIGGMPYRTWVWASNNSNSEATFERYFIRSGSNGTSRSVEPTVVTLEPGENRLLATGSTQGMLEIFASDDVQIQARLVPTGTFDAAGQGVALPVISSANAVAAGETVHLLGWERKDDGATSYSNLGVVNLAHQATNCSVSVWNKDGAAVVEDFPLSFQPLSHNQFDQVLAILGQTEVDRWRVAVSCDQPFFPYLSIYYPESNRAVFQEGAASGRSELSRPQEIGENFIYQSDFPILRSGGFDQGPFLDSSGAEFHDPRGWFGGHVPIRINGVTYEKGVSFYPKWGRTPFLEYDLDGQYALYTADIRIDDYFFNKYEWGIVEADTGRYIRLERPSDGYRGRETANPIRIGASATFRIIGDGETLYQSDLIYAYGPPVKVEIDVRGVKILRLQLQADGREQLDAPYRNGLTRARTVLRCSWFDMISFADGKLYPAVP